MGLYNFVRGCRWAYKRDELYPKGLIIMRNKKRNVSKRATAVLVEKRFKVKKSQ